MSVSNAKNVGLPFFEKYKYPQNDTVALKTIAKHLQISIDGISFQQSNDVLFSEVYQRCRLKDWEKLQGIKNELDHLVNTVGQTILAVCIHEKDEDLFDDLLRENISLHTISENGKLPIHFAAEVGVVKFVKALTTKNKINAENQTRMTPLHFAAYHGHREIVSLLLRQDTKLMNYDACWNYGATYLNLTPIALTILGGHIECTHLFLKCYPQVINTKIANIGNLLHLAIFFQQNHLLEIFLTTYYDQFRTQLLEELNDRGQTPLMLAAYLGNYKALSLLHKKNVKLDESNKEGNTALHWAVIGKQENSVSLLIRLGANFRLRNREELEPDRLAKALGAKSIEALISNQIVPGSYHQNTTNLSYIDYPPENVVFKGGGPAGIVLLGAIEELEKRSFTSLKRVAGTSAGFIFATFVAFNLKSARIKEIMNDLNLMDLLDHPMIDLKSAMMKPEFKDIFITFLKLSKACLNPLKTSFSVVKNCLQVLRNLTGICEGEKFRKLMEQYIEEATGIQYCTFKELRELINQGKPFKHLHGFATKIGPNAEILHMNSEDSQWDDLIISDAARGSMSIPGVFKPHRLHVKKEGQRVPMSEEFVVVDGGMLNNLALEAFDRMKYTTTNFTKENQEFPIFNKRTIGISIYHPETKVIIPDKEVGTLAEFLKSIIGIYSDAERLIRNTTNPYNENRIIEIDNCGVGLLSFNITDEQKKQLILSGKTSVINFFKKQKEEFLGLFEDGKSEEKDLPIEGLENNNNLEKEEKKFPEMIPGIIPTEVPSKQIGAKPGLYALAKCDNKGNCEKYQKEEWVYQGDHGIFNAHEIHSKLKCSCCKELIGFDKVHQLAFNECSFKMEIHTNEEYGNLSLSKDYIARKEFAKILENYTTSAASLKIVVKAKK